jgi:hypothetical protein
MHDGQDIHAAIRQAEAAASRGDMAVAEEFLRRAVELQQAAPGIHPDLADTLNNLAIVCERLGKDDEAERCYRQAYATARTAFPPGHPSVTTSETNLREFCAVRGLPFEPAAPTPEPPVAAVPSAAPGSPDPLPARPPSPPRAAEPVMGAPPAGGLSRTVLIVGLVLAAIVALAILMRPTHAPTAEPAAAPPVQAAGPEAARPAPPQPTAPAPAASAPAPLMPAPRPESAPAAKPPPAADHTPASGPPPRLIQATLCRALKTGATWDCTPLDGAPESGTVYFFTIVAAPADTSVQHRWYQGDRLHQAVTLRVGANPAGYRTYSQLTVTAARAGRWRVEVRTAGGTVLAERRFTVGGQR